MNSKVYHKITYFTASACFLVLTVYALIRFKVRFLLPDPKGDETSFLEAFQFFKVNGFEASVENGSSILFNSVVWFFSLFGASDLMTLRITSLVFGLATLFVALYLAKKFFNLSRIYFIIFAITGFNILVISSVYLSGINDTLLFFLISVLFYRIYSIWNNGYALIKDSLWLGLILGAMLLTRMMSVIYFIPLALILWLLFRKQKLSFLTQAKIGALTLLILSVTVAVPNIPSLSKGKGLSFHIKKLDDRVGWPELQYLTALENSKGNIAYGKHVSVEDVVAYIEKNGEASLPKTLTESLFMDFGFTVKEFFKDLAIQLKPISRNTGLLLLFIILALFIKRKQLFQLTQPKIILLFTFIFIAVLCFIVVNYVEPRWYIGLLILMSISVFQMLQDALENTKQKELLSFGLLNLHLLLLMAMSASYILKNYQQLA